MLMCQENYLKKRQKLPTPKIWPGCTQEIYGIIPGGKEGLTLTVNHNCL